jgi:hypothetical protein
MAAVVASVGRVPHSGKHLAYLLIVPALLALAGCVSEPAARPAPRMPQVTLPPAGATVPPPAPVAADVLAQALEKVNAGDVAGASRALETLAAAERAAVLRDLLAVVARPDAMRAGRVAATIPRGALRGLALELAAPAMVARDPDATLRWASGLPDAEVRFEASRAVADRLVEREGRAALDRVQALPDSRNRDDFLVLAAARWSRRDAPAAIAWLRGLPDGELKTRATTSVGFEIAQTTPERAVEVADMLPAGRERWLLLTTIGQTWVARDSSAAMAWVQSLPAGDARTAAVAGLDAGLGVFSARDRTVVGGLGAASAGVVAGSARVRPPPIPAESLPPGPERERALRARFDELMLASPALAASYVTSLFPQDRSDGMMLRLAREWLPYDPAARVWVEQNVPFPEQRESMLREAGLWRR